MASTRHLADAEAEAPSTGALVESQLHEMASRKVQSLCISLAWPQSLVPGSGGLMAEMPSNLAGGNGGARHPTSIGHRPSASGHRPAPEESSAPAKPAASSDGFRLVLLDSAAVRPSTLSATGCTSNSTCGTLGRQGRASWGSTYLARDDVGTHATVHGQPPRHPGPGAETKARGVRI